MLSVNWASALSQFLWITPNVLLGGLAVVLWKRGWYREFPCFFAYMLYQVAENVLMYVLFKIRVSGNQYAYAWTAMQLLSIALRFGVIDEVSKNLLHESQFLKVAARRSLQGITGLLLGTGILLAVWAPGNTRPQWFASVTVVTRGAAMVQTGLLLSLLLFSRFLGLSWRRHAFGITLGLGIMTSVDLATYALRAEFVSWDWTRFLNFIITGTYLVCASIWTRYLLVPELKPVPVTVVPDEEVETWNKEFQHLLRQ
jgi:hypothetical protein